jgi:hypothetical protein
MRCVVLLAAIALAGCATLPQTERVGEFGKATNSAMSFAKDTVTANQTIAMRVNDEALAQQYLAGLECPLKQDGSKDGACLNFSLSAKLQHVLSKDRSGLRLRALTALADYGEALAEAANKGQIEKLQNAAVKLGDAASAIAGAVPMVSPIAVPAIKITARGFGFLLGNVYAAEILDVIRINNDNVAKLAGLLATDFAEIADLLDHQARTYDKARKATLSTIRDGNTVDKLRLYTEFKSARQDNAAIVTLANASKEFGKIFKKLAETHDALAHDDPDSEVILQNFIVLLGDAADLVKAAQAPRKS